MPDMGLSLYVEMRTCGHLPASRSGSPLIAALSQAGRLEAALLVLRDMARCADGSGSAVAPALSALVEQPEDGRIYGAKHSGQDAESQQLQKLAKSLPHLELSYRVEGEEDVFMPDSTGASANSQALSQSDTSSSLHRTENATANSLDLRRSSRASIRDSSSGPQRKRSWSWASNVDAHNEPSQQSTDQVHQTVQSPKRPNTSNSTRSRKKGQQKRQKRKRHALRKSDMLPTIDAVAAIVLASVIASEELVAAQLYEQLQRQGSAALSGLLQHGSRVFELLIEGFCRGGRVHDALSIFDDWKAARDLVVQQRLLSNNVVKEAVELPSASEASPGQVGRLRVPKLSNVTLAFLEASCHACSDQEDVQWRVYDVCALMRQQQEEKKTHALLSPKKGSHHVREEW